MIPFPRSMKACHYNRKNLSFPGVPVSDEPPPGALQLPPTTPTPGPSIISTEPSTTTTQQQPQPQQEPEGHSMDDLLPGRLVHPTLEFVDAPQHTETQLGASVLLACRTAEPVLECRWSWRPLPPTHLPLPNIDDSSAPHCELVFFCL